MRSDSSADMKVLLLTFNVDLRFGDDKNSVLHCLKMSLQSHLHT